MKEFTTNNFGPLDTDNIEQGDKTDGSGKTPVEIKAKDAPRDSIDGTQITADLMNNMVLGPISNLFKETNTIPNNIDESRDASQVVDAYKELMDTRSDARIASNVPDLVTSGATSVVNKRVSPHIPIINRHNVISTSAIIFVYIRQVERNRVVPGETYKVPAFEIKTGWTEIHFITDSNGWHGRFTSFEHYPYLLIPGKSTINNIGLFNNDTFVSEVERNLSYTRFTIPLQLSKTSTFDGTFEDTIDGSTLYYPKVHVIDDSVTIAEDLSMAGDRLFDSTDLGLFFSRPFKNALRQTALSSGDVTLAFADYTSVDAAVNYHIDSEGRTTHLECVKTDSRNGHNPLDIDIDVTFYPGRAFNKINHDRVQGADFIYTPEYNFVDQSAWVIGIPIIII